VPTFGFDLTAGDDVEGDLDSALDFAGRLFNTILDGDRELEVRAVENLYIIPLRVTASLWDFNMTLQEMDHLYNEGFYGALTFFHREIGPKDPKKAREFLRAVHHSVLVELQERGVSPQHLRVNVIMRTNLDRLRLLYCHNMDNDADDRMEFGVGEGAAGECWARHDPVLCDMEDARASFRTRWKMTKYQQAMIRPTIKSLLCVPIFDQRQFDPQRDNKQNPMIGILSLDSDEDLLEPFSRREIQQIAVDHAKMVADWLR
jgi:hypothetical protein